MQAHHAIEWFDASRALIPAQTVPRTVMRAVIVGGIALTLWASGCSRETPQHGLAQQWLDALNSHDPNQVIALMDANATYWEPAMPQALSPEGLRGWLNEGWRVWKDRVYSATRVVDSADVLVIEWHMRQTHPNGRAVPIDGVTILDVHDGRIGGVRTYYDKTPLLQFLTPPR